MGISLFIESLTAATSVGIGCGTCCGSGISVALYSYLTTHMKNMKQSFLGFLEFFLGKCLAVIFLCGMASFVGTNIIDETGDIFGVRTALVVDGFMLLMGIWLLIGWLREKYGHNHCKNCHSCSDKHSPIPEYKKANHIALISMGLGYGISPCVPLILMTGYATSLPVGYAVLLGTVFALASTLSPMLFMLLMSGILAGKMYKETPQYLIWFRLLCYITLIVVFSVGLLRELSIL